LGKVLDPRKMPKKSLLAVVILGEIGKFLIKKGQKGPNLGQNGEKRLKLDAKKYLLAVVTLGEIGKFLTKSCQKVVERAKF
jgi:hypothetical protein